MIFEESAFNLENPRQDQQIIYYDIVKNVMYETI